MRTKNNATSLLKLLAISALTCIFVVGVGGNALGGDHDDTAFVPRDTLREFFLAPDLTETTVDRDCDDIFQRGTGTVESATAHGFSFFVWEAINITRRILPVLY